MITSTAPGAQPVSNNNLMKVHIDSMTVGPPSSPSVIGTSNPKITNKTLKLKRLAKSPGRRSTYATTNNAHTSREGRPWAVFSDGQHISTSIASAATVKTSTIMPTRTLFIVSILLPEIDSVAFSTPSATFLVALDTASTTSVTAFVASDITSKGLAAPLSCSLDNVKFSVVRSPVCKRHRFTSCDSTGSAPSSSISASSSCVASSSEFVGALAQITASGNMKQYSIKPDIDPSLD
mmetsp:Transcript_157654/g.278258  ORF Transcript_157654/g.278258 Transcript_157654/m.278258 type:complete len:236 (-) Transcript_157654:65-772(-)